ncbi:MAG: site-2 protease family protein [Actinomycetota bacterium]|nr:site-2 protease family protein [Actinomycetota bacterium]
MTFTLGVILTALGIGVSIMLHEAGHMLTAKRFGMKVTRYFLGFGPTLWSFRRGETEYGIKALPFGGFVKIVGMTPLEDDVEPGDEGRVFWRQSVPKRTLVLSAGSLTHFGIAIVLIYVAAVWTGLPNPVLQHPERLPAVIGTISPCVITKYETKPSGELRDCKPGDPVAPAKTAGFRPGDRITAVAGTSTSTWEAVVRLVRKATTGPVAITYLRAGRTHTVNVTPAVTQRPPLTASANSTKRQSVGTLGIAEREPPATVTYGPVAAVGRTGSTVGQFVTGTFAALARFPQKVPAVFRALAGDKRDASGPISVVGASRLGGEAVASKRPGATSGMLGILASLNFFIGVFNLFPLLPLDGGHIAVVWFERVRSWWAARRGRPDPGRVDYNRLLPITYAFVVIFGGISLLTIAADVINPIANPFQ